MLHVYTTRKTLCVYAHNNNEKEKKHSSKDMLKDCKKLNVGNTASTHINVKLWKWLIISVQASMRG